MEQIFMLLAMTIPEDELLDNLQEEITTYRESRSEDEKKRMMMTLGLLTAKYSNEGKGTAEAIKEFADAKARHELFKPNKQ